MFIYVGSRRRERYILPRWWIFLNLHDFTPDFSRTFLPAFIPQAAPIVLTLYVLFFLREHKHIFAFYVILPHWFHTGT